MSHTSVKFWTFFWQYGFIIMLPIEIFILLMIPNTNLVLFGVIFAITFIVPGIDYIFASIYKMPHIYCINQSIKRQLITYYPYEMDWKNNFDKKQMIGLGIIFIMIGVIIILGSIFIFLFG